LLTQLPDQIKPIAVGQANIDDGNGVTFGLKAVFEFRQSGGDRNDMVVLRQEVSQFAPQNALVFKKDDLGHGRSLCIKRSLVTEQT
jgi:hypothetical protein